MRTLARIAFVLIGTYLLFCLAMFVLQRQLIYHPATRNVALDLGLLPGASVVTLATDDSEEILAWWLPPLDASKPVYLYLPGNADTLANRAARFGLLTNEGAGLLAVSWRGYGGSSGTPSESGFQQDALAAYQWLVSQTAAERIIVFGESLGSGIAIRLAATRPSGALVLDAAYPSLLAVTQYRMPWLPALLMREKFEIKQSAPQITVPLLQRHCRKDAILPYALAQQLFETFASPDKQFVTVEERCHLPTLEPLRDRLRGLEQLLSSVEP